MEKRTEDYKHYLFPAIAAMRDSKEKLKIEIETAIEKAVAKRLANELEVPTSYIRGLMKAVPQCTRIMWDVVIETRADRLEKRKPL